MATAGDVNGDGYGDVIVGAPCQLRQLARGRRAGLRLPRLAPRASAATPAWTAESDQAAGSSALSVATAGDVNGDGYADVIVGAYRYGNGQAREGRAYLYLAARRRVFRRPRPGRRRATRRTAQFGDSVATAGDVNGDGYADVIVGAPCYDNGQTDEGRAYVYLGSASGPAPRAGLDGGERPGGRLLRHSVATAGDVNGDGYSRRHRRSACTTTTARRTRGGPTSTSARPRASPPPPPGRPRATRPTPSSAARWRRRGT